MKRLSRPVLGITIVFTVIVAGFIYFFLWATAAISAADSRGIALSQQLATVQGQASSASSQLSSAISDLSSVRGQLSSANTRVSSLQSELATSKSQVSSLQSELAASKSQISSLQTDLASSRSQLVTSNTDLSSCKSQVSSLQSQLVSTGSANITTLQEQVALLQKQNTDLTDIAQLKRVSVKADMVAINQQSGLTFWLARFTADYAGYIVVAGQSSIPDAYITVDSSFPDYPLNDYKYLLGSRATITIPVLPGAVNVTYHNPNPGGVSTGVATVKYYY